MAELLPCPFCGEKPILNVRDELYQIKCNNADCWIVPHTSLYSLKVIAITAWNTRTPKELTKVEHNSLCETQTYKGGE